MESKIRVLHVEDDPCDSELLELALRRGGLEWEIHRVDRRDALIDALESEDIGVIVCDNTLPGMTGFEALREAQARRPDIPFVFYTGTLGEERAVEAVKAGASDVVIKGTGDRLIPALLRAQRETKEREARRRAEAELRESELRYRNLFHHTPVPTWILDPETHRFVDVNEAAIAHYGYGRDEFLTMTALDIRPPEDADRYLKTVAMPGLTQAGYWRHRTKDGRLIWVDVAAHDIVLQGRSLRLVASNDITEVVEAKSVLEAINRQQAALARLSHVALTTVDVAAVMNEVADTVAAVLNVELSAVTELVNEGQALLLRAGRGWQPDCVGNVLFPLPAAAAREFVHAGVSMRFDDLRTDGRFDPDQVVLAHGVNSGISATIEGLHQPFGRLGALTTRRRAFTDDELRFLEAAAAILATAIEKQHTEETLKRQRLALHQTEKVAAMGSLLAGVAHELNNPLAAVVGLAGLMKRNADASVQERADKLVVAAERCARIVKNFLALARDRPPERERMALTQVIGEALELVAYPLRMDSIEVETDLAKDLPALWADPHQVHQVIVNLVTNAHHALKAIEGPRRIRIEVRRSETPGFVTLDVHDNGPGMPPEVAARVFEPFFTTKPTGQGTGLGLPLCLGIVESHGGRLELDTEPGRGTRFRVTLPAARSAQAGVEPVRPTEPAPSSARGQRILVVDDEEVMAELLADVLTDWGYQVDKVSDARLALEKMRHVSYDLVISDLRMPGLDGREFYRLAEQQQAGVSQRFVFVTGDTLTAGASEFLENSGRPFLVKPFSVGDCARVIHAALAASGGRQH
jgi:PAS domain S-box-containing protein